MLRNLPLIIFSLALISCSEKDSYDPAHDYFTFANTDQFVTRHIALDLDVDFAEKTLSGSVVLNMTVLDVVADTIILDTRDIAVSGVVFIAADGETESAIFEMGASDDSKGTPLIISAPPGLDADTEIVVRVDYVTSPNASALQWLPPELTAAPPRDRARPAGS